MDIIVCLKRVPDLEEIDIEIAPDGLSINTEDLAFGLSEWDSCAIEEAIRIRDDQGGSVTAITVGDADADEVLRRALAMGADEAVLVTWQGQARPDGYQTACLLSSAIAERHFDLILTGSVSGDSGAGLVGGMLSALVGVPQVALATSMEVHGDILRVQHEVENGLERVVEVDLPALVSVQTGINEPRYVSIRGIRKVSRVEIPEFVTATPLEDPWTTVEGLSMPASDTRAEILEGSAEDMVDMLIHRLKERGGI